MQVSKKNKKDYPFPYHSELVLTIESLTQTGSGIARVKLPEDDETEVNTGGWVVQVPFTIPGEKVRVRVFRNHKNYSEADLLEVIEPSENRVEPRCKLFTHCGGCQLQHMKYSEQLRWKKEGVADVLLRLAGVECQVADVVPSPAEYGYRTKITPHFHKPKSGVVGPIGFLRQGQRQNLVDVWECPIAREEINGALKMVRSEVHRRAEKYKKGATLLLRAADNGVHTQAYDICRQRVGELEFLHPAGAFFQNNAHILPTFTQYIAKVASGFGAKNLLDVYCGSGLLGLCAAKFFTEVIGVEISEDSRHWAVQNAAHNGIKNAKFVLGDADQIFAHAPAEAADTVVILDPPRAGCSPSFLQQLMSYSPKAIVYVSCHPGTQARDIKSMISCGYEVRSVTPFDLFPQTHHVESVVALSR